MKLKNASSYLCWYKIMKVELRAIEIKRFHYENGREPLFNSSIYNVCSVESLTVNAGTLGMGNATEMAGEKTLHLASEFIHSLVRQGLLLVKRAVAVVFCARGF